MSEASTEVLLDDFENKDNWELAGPGAERTHLTTFAEGAPWKRPGVYADGAAGADHRAVVLLIRSATEGFAVELAARADRPITVAGPMTALCLWVRSPHASLTVGARLRHGGADTEVDLGRVTAAGEWTRLEFRPAEPLADVELRAVTIRLDEVVKRAGEVMILFDDLTAATGV